MLLQSRVVLLFVDEVILIENHGSQIELSVVRRDQPY